MLDMAILEIGVEGLEIDKVRDIGVGGRTVVALIEVIRKDLPVEIAIDLVGMVELVIVKVEFAVSLLLVDVVKMLFPRHFGSLFGVHVDPDEAIGIDLDVDAEQTVLLLLVAFQILVSWSLGELSVQSIRPAVISASKDLCVAFFLLYDRVSPVSADVVEGIDVSSTVSVNDDIVTCDIEAEEVSGILDAGAVCHKEPSASEDGSSFELVHLRRCVP